MTGRHRVAGRFGARRDASFQSWHTGRAVGYGAAIGLAAAAFKLAAPWAGLRSPLAIAEELTGAALAFGLLCGVAAAVRNIIVARVLGPR